MTKPEMEEAVAEAQRVIHRIEGGFKSTSLAGELEFWRGILRDREAWLRGEIIITARWAETESPEEMRRRSYSKLKDVVENARMHTELEIIAYLRSHKFMCHSPLRKIERAWLVGLFAGDRQVSLSRLTLPFDLGEANVEEMGGHVNQFGHNFRCTHCPDSISKRKK